jgi:hypothetical protein
MTIRNRSYFLALKKFIQIQKGTEGYTIQCSVYLYNQLAGGIIGIITV